MKDLGAGGSAWTLDKFRVTVYPLVLPVFFFVYGIHLFWLPRDGGSYSVGIQLRERNDATSLLLTGRDPASEIRSVHVYSLWFVGSVSDSVYLASHYQEELKGYEESYSGLLSQEQSIKQAWMKGRDTFEALKVIIPVVFLIGVVLIFGRKNNIMLRK